MHMMHVPLFATTVGYYGLAIVSAVLPWVNAEVLMLSAVPMAGSTPQLGTLVVAVSLGQMTGKSAMYWLARHTGDTTRWPRWHRSLDTWRARLAGRPRSALIVTFISALVGFPPFFLVSLVAGIARVGFGWFLAVGTVGRLLHFAAVAVVPGLVRRLL